MFWQYLAYLGWGVIVLPLTIVMVALSVWAIWRCVTRVRGSGHAMCGRCGYEVSGLSALDCPECGGDLRTVGIRTRAWATKHRGSLLWAILGLALICSIIGSVASNVVVTWFEATHFTGAFRSSTTSLSASSSAISSVELESRMTWDSTNTTSTVRVELVRPDQERIVITGDPGAGEVDVETERGTALATDVPFTPRALIEVLEKGGIDTDDEATRADLDDVCRLLDVAMGTPYAWLDVSAMTLSGLKVTNQNSTSSTTGPSAGFWGETANMVAIGVGCFLLWVIGCALVWARRRHLLRDAGWVRPNRANT